MIFCMDNDVIRELIILVAVCVCVQFIMHANKVATPFRWAHIRITERFMCP